MEGLGFCFRFLALKRCMVFNLEVWWFRGFLVESMNGVCYFRYRVLEVIEEGVVFFRFGDREFRIEGSV